MNGVVVGVATVGSVCRCPYCVDPLPPSREIDDLGDKLAAKLLLVGGGVHLLVPGRDEWIGLNKMSRDGEL